MIMCKLKYIFFAIAFWPVFIVQGQKPTSCDAVLNSLIEPNLTGDSYQSPLPLSSIGSQFFIEDWLNGDIYLSNKNIVRNMNLRYNAYLDMLIWLTPLNYEQVKLDKAPIEGFCLNGKSGATHCFIKIPIKYDLSFDSLVVFGEVLYQSRISLFAYRRVDFAGYDINSTDYYIETYKLSTLYLFRLENGKTIGFRRYKKRDVVKLFPDKKEMIIAKLRELKQHHFRTEADLINITKALNEAL
jgi:hypothetical protein